MEIFLLVVDQIFNHLTRVIATLISINITYFLSITPWFPSYLNVKRDQLWSARGRRENRFNFTFKLTSDRPVYEMVKIECHYIHRFISASEFVLKILHLSVIFLFSLISLKHPFQIFEITFQMCECLDGFVFKHGPYFTQNHLVKYTYRVFFQPDKY